MKRKQFFRNVSLIGVAISLAPTRLFSFPSQYQITLPSAAVHIPHGNFADTRLNSIRIPEFEVELSVQHFMRNGIEPSHQDVSIFTFRKGNELLNVCFNDNGCHTSGEIQGIKPSYSKTRFVLTNERFEVELRTDTTYLEVRKR